MRKFLDFFTSDCSNWRIMLIYFRNCWAKHLQLIGDWKRYADLNQIIIPDQPTIPDRARARDRAQQFTGPNPNV